MDGAVGSAVSGLTQALSSIEQEQQAVVAPNACSINNGGCSSDATCMVKGKDFYCECKPGYTGTGIVCSDVNECTAKNSPCPNNSTCTNTVGSFSCACNAGYMMVNKQCKVSTAPSCSTNNGGCSLNATCSAPSGTVVCTCNSGYTGNGTTCTDVNECATNNGGCYANAFCTNTPGSRTCTCNSGYSGDGITTCTDINECLTNNGGCSTNGGVCTNTAGGRTCSCGSGYTGNGLTCADINECASGNGGCSANATCTNTPGARTCGCNTGYAGDGVTCTDINECATTNGGCDLQHGVCTNTVGTRTCACEPGYSGNGFTCTQDAQDTVVPSLTSVTVPEGNIAAGVPFAVSATATDNISGVKSITFGLTWWTDFTPGGYYPDGHFAAYCTVSATPPYALSLTNGCNMTLPAQALAGTYTVWASVTDGANNVHYYDGFGDSLQGIANHETIVATSKGDFDLPVLDHISGIPAAEINATVERQIFNIGVQAFDSGSGVADIRIRWIRDGYTQNPNPVVYSAYDIGDCVFGGASLSVQQGPRADLQTSIGTCEMIVETIDIRAFTTRSRGRRTGLA